MEGQITMSAKEQRRAQILNRGLAGTWTRAQAAATLRRSERQVRRLLRAYAGVRITPQEALCMARYIGHGQGSCRESPSGVAGEQNVVTKTLSSRGSSGTTPAHCSTYCSTRPDGQQNGPPPARGNGPPLSGNRAEGEGFEPSIPLRV